MVLSHDFYLSNAPWFTRRGFGQGVVMSLMTFSPVLLTSCNLQTTNYSRCSNAE